MSKNVALFVDVANLYYSARGQDVDVDYVALLKHATKGRDLIRAYAYSGLDPENENQRKFIDFLGKNGYKVVHKDIRKFGDGRVKANLDIELVVDLFRLADRMDIAVIVSGDGDFAPAIRALQDGGVRCEVISFRPNTSSDLIAVADEFTDIMKIMGIGRQKDEKGLSMPEMPAKEVNPEFGFREASRGVAAAALAALRDGEKATTRPRGRRTSRAAAPAAAESAVATDVSEAAAEAAAPAATAATAAAGAESDTARRRRRRRGGRGRGRGRRDEGQTGVTEQATGGTEVGWQEFDDLSQIADLTDLGEPGLEREFTFSEADAETLAELGLAPAAAGTAAPAEPASAEPAASVEPAAPTTAGRRTRRPRRKAEAPQAETPPAEEEVAQAETPTEPATAATLTRGPGTRSARSGARSRASGTDAAAAAPAATEPAATEEPAPATSAAQSRTTRSGRGRSSGAGGRTGGSQSESIGGGADAAPASAAKTTRRAPARATRARRASTGASEGAGEGGTPPDSAGESGDATEGIWQRFRSGRRTGSGS